MNDLSRTRGQKVFSVFNTFLLIIISLTCVIPFVHLLAVSFSGSTAVAAGKVLFWPVDFTLSSYEFALTGRFPRALMISVLRVLLGVSANVICCILVAYPLSRKTAQFRGRNIIAGFFIVTMILNGGLIPTYLVVSRLGLLNTLWALVLPGILPVNNMLILMNFIRQLPGEVEEAALIDGAGPFRALWSVLLPLLKPSLATIALFSILGHWNDWFGGMMYIQDMKDYPLQTYLQTLLKSMDEIIRMAANDYKRMIALMNARTGRAAQLFLGALPVICIYPFLQRYFATGLVIGSVKG